MRNGRVMVCNGINPIKVINPIQNWGGKKLDPKLDPLYVKSYQKNFHFRRL